MPTLDQLRNTILELEASHRQGYIPSNADGTIIGNSGVTVAGGLDLGQQTADSLRDMNLPQDLITSFTPYLGLTGQAAQIALANSPLSVNQQQETTINNQVVQGYWDDLSDTYQARVGTPISDLSENQQLALHSAHHNLGGAGLFGTAGNETNFTRQLEQDDFTGAANNLYSWHNANGTLNQLDPRRQAEAALFQGLIPHTGLSERKDARIAMRDAAGTPESILAYRESPYHAPDHGLVNTNRPQVTVMDQQPQSQEVPPTGAPFYNTNADGFITSYPYNEDAFLGSTINRTIEGYQSAADTLSEFFSELFGDKDE